MRLTRLMTGVEFRRDKNFKIRPIGPKTHYCRRDLRTMMIFVHDRVHASPCLMMKPSTNQHRSLSRVCFRSLPSFSVHRTALHYPPCASPIWVVPWVAWNRSR